MRIPYAPILLVILISLTFFMPPAGASSASVSFAVQGTVISPVGGPPWVSSTWTKRCQIDITGHGSEVSGYQVRVPVTYDADMKADFSDLRFTTSDGVSLIPFWFETVTSGSQAVAWVRVPTIPAAGTTIYMYYGNPAATSASNGPATFEFFDNFETATSQVWQDKAKSPTASGDGSAAVYNGKLYLFGGYTTGPGTATRATQMYDPATNTWTAKASMLTPARWGHVAVERNGLIYVFAGTAPGPGDTTRLEVYNPTSNTWSTKTPVPEAIGHQGLMGVHYTSATQDNIHLFFKNYHYVYTPNSNGGTYSRLADVPTSRTWATAAVVDGKIYLIGGCHYASSSATTCDATNVNEVYDPVANTWTTKAPMPAVKYGQTRESPVINGKIYVTHGKNGGFYTSNFVYTPATNSWEEKSPALYQRDGVACGVINNVLYVVGGRQSSSAPVGLKYTEAYNPATETTSIWYFSDISKVTRSTSYKVDGSYSLLFNDDMDSKQWAEHLQNMQTLALDFDLRMTNDLGTPGPQARFAHADPNKGDFGMLYYYNDGNTGTQPRFKWHPGLTLLQAGSYNTWYRVSISWNGAQSKVTINDADYMVGASNVISDRIRLETSSTEKTRMYIDRVRVRQYVNPAPKATVGKETKMEDFLPSATFTSNVTTSPVPLTVKFTDTSTNYPIAFSWDFGDGTTSTLQNPVHTYTVKGNYDVTHTARNANGALTVTQKNYIKAKDAGILAAILGL